MVDDTRVRARRPRYNSTAKSWGIIHLPTPLSRVLRQPRNAESRLNSDIGACPRSTNKRRMHRSKFGDSTGYPIRLTRGLVSPSGVAARKMVSPGGKAISERRAPKRHAAWARVAVRCSAMSLRRLACGDISALRSRARAALTRSSRCASCEGSSRWPSAAQGGHLFGRYCPRHLAIRRWVDSTTYCL
jgi:hypothetical protein